MKKIYKIFTAVLIFPFLICIVYAQNENKVVDDANFLSSYEKTDLENKIGDIVKKYSFDVVIVISDNIENMSPEQFADNYFDRNGYGVGPNRDGILLLIAMDQRQYHISTAGYGITVFSDVTIEEIGSDIKSYLKDEDYYGAFETYLDYVERCLNVASQNNSDLASTHKDSSSSNVFEKLGLVILVSFLASLLIVTMMKRRMKTARPKNYAGDYIKNFRLKRQQDIFLRRTITKVRHHEYDQSRGNSGNSSTHTSDSGTSHGGGGGSF